MASTASKSQRLGRYVIIVFKLDSRLFYLRAEAIRRLFVLCLELKSFSLLLSVTLSVVTTV